MTQPAFTALDLDTDTSPSVDGLDLDTQGAIFELAEFAGLIGDEPADDDFAALPHGVQLAIHTLANWADFSGEPAEPAAPTATGGCTSADARAEAIAKGPSPEVAQLAKEEAQAIHEFIQTAKAEGAAMRSKPEIWKLIQDAAIESSPANGMESVEEGIARFLETPAGGALYTAWKAAPDADASASYTAPLLKSESEPSVIGAAVRKARAERVAGIHALAAEMTAAAK